jgi:hypothetical protein
MVKNSATVTAGKPQFRQDIIFTGNVTPETDLLGTVGIKFCYGYRIVRTAISRNCPSGSLSP